MCDNDNDLHRDLADLRAGVQEVIDARGRGDFAALLPKLRALLDGGSDA